jgi:hypothetical protein
MRVVAAAFDDKVAATRALEELRGRYGLRPEDASIAPLGDDDGAAGRTVLAGRFVDEAMPAIQEIVAHHGGEVVSEVDEAWTRSPDLSGGPPRSESRFH